MPSVPIKYVVSFTSQDDRYPVSNLVSGDGLRKWLSSPSERSGLIEAVFQLEQPCLISYIDIGSVWCASLEVKVGCSDWPAGREYETLVYTVSLMSPADCTLGRNPNKTQMFSADVFCADIAKKKWDRVKIICRQPFKKTAQFGLSFLRVKSSTVAEESTKSAFQQPSVTQPACVSSIRDHFLGKLNKSNTFDNSHLKSKLLKISSTTDGSGGVVGMENDVSLSRTAKLVLVASGTSTQGFGSNTPSTLRDRVGMYSSSVDQKYTPQFDAEVDEFLFSLTFQPNELDTITIADVRHKMERKKRRKLTKDEKKLFIEKTKTYISTLYSNGRTETNASKGSVSSDGIVNNTVSQKDNINCNTNLKMEQFSKNEQNNFSVDKQNSNNIQLNNYQPDPKKATNPKGVTDTAKGEITPTVKRKLDGYDIVTPPAKKTKIAESSPSVRQKMKIAEKESTITTVKNGIVNQIQKAFSVIKNVTGQAEPGSSKTPFQYKGLRWKAGKDENEDDKINESVNVKEDMSAEGFKNINGLSKVSDEGMEGKQEINTDMIVPHSVNLVKDLVSSDDDECMIDRSLSSGVKFKPISQRQRKNSGNRGRAAKRGRGRGIKKLDCSDFFLSSDSDDSDLDISCDLDRSIGRDRGQKVRGEGRGQKTKRSQSSADSSQADATVLSPTPPGFVKCPGCNDFFCESLLPAHKMRCSSLKQNPALAPSTPSSRASELSVPSRSPAGRGRGKKSRSTAASLEIRPTGFMKCDGCNEYFGPTLLQIHQGQCLSFLTRMKPGDSGSTDPWMCAKPSPVSKLTSSFPARQSPKTSTNKKSSSKSMCSSSPSIGQSPKCLANQNTPDKSLKSPPWLLAAERRMTQNKNGQSDISLKQSKANGNSIKTPAPHSANKQSHRNEFENCSNNSKNQTGSQLFALKNRSISNNTVGQSNNIGGHFHVELDSESSDSDSHSDLIYQSMTQNGVENSGLDESTIQVECPLCGDFYPSLVIEQHAAVCNL